MVPALNEFQLRLRAELEKLLAEHGVDDVRSREKVAAADEETGLPGERTLVLGFPLGRGRGEVWIYEDEVGVDAPGEEWLAFDGLEYEDEARLRQAVLDYVAGFFED